MKDFIYKILRVIFASKCPECKDGRVWHDHTELNLEVYECDTCGKQFV